MTVEKIPEKKLHQPSTTCLSNINNGRDNLEYLLSIHPVEIAIVLWFKNCKQKQFPFIPSIGKLNIEMAVKTLMALYNSDGYSTDIVLYVLDFSISDKFWKENILSITPLRKVDKDSDMTKFDKLVPKVKMLERVIEQENNDSGENGVVFKAFEY